MGDSFWFLAEGAAEGGEKWLPLQPKPRGCQHSLQGKAFNAGIRKGHTCQKGAGMCS